jgi:peptidoglycan-associated lipoprotein
MQQNFEQAQKCLEVQIASMDSALESASHKQIVLGIESNIQFKTAFYVLEEHYRSQLDLIADAWHRNFSLIKNKNLGLG